MMSDEGYIEVNPIHPFRATQWFYAFGATQDGVSPPDESVPLYHVKCIDHVIRYLRSGDWVVFIDFGETKGYVVVPVEEFQERLCTIT